MIAAQWEQNFQDLKDYKERHGTLKVSIKTHKNLNSWCDHQRRQNKLGRMTDERRAKLDSIGFIWQVQAKGPDPMACRKDEQWFMNYNQLVEYHKQHGHIMVPRKDDDGNDIPLGIWLNTQRKNYKASLMPEDRKRLLESLGIVWNITSTRQQENFNQMYSLLQEFHMRHGHCHVSYQGEDANPKLANWISYQRKLYSVSSSSLYCLVRLSLFQRRNPTLIFYVPFFVRCSLESLSQVI
jgi:hypothetical protein